MVKPTQENESPKVIRMGGNFPLELGLCFIMICGAVGLFGLVVGVANGNVHLHWPTLHEIWQSLLRSIVD